MAVNNLKWHQMTSNDLEEPFLKSYSFSKLKIVHVRFFGSLDFGYELDSTLQSNLRTLGG